MIKRAQKNTEEIINHKETRMVKDGEDFLSNRPRVSTVHSLINQAGCR